MSAPLQLSMGIEASHRNQSLFSDHYLNTLLPTDPRWNAALPEAQAFLAWLQDLYRREQNHLAGYNESQLEEHWFKPILSQLGHVFEPQAGVPGLDRGIKYPDYVFFPSEAARQSAVSAQKTGDYAAQALAVGEVKAWDVPLGKRQKGGGASFDAQNPSFQIDYYLRATGLKWGILSNGRLWRLVHADSSYRLSIYYEVDLVDLLSRADASAVRYFTLFFRQAAFRPDAQRRLFLADALAASKAYALALEEDLQHNVYQALEKLVQGFLDLPGNGLGQADLRQIYENSLYLLYRLLFILYGESWGLLPIHNPAYRDHYSLHRLKREFAGLASPPAPMTQKYWGDMQQLFQIINGDNAALNQHLGVPRYNGRLFDPEQHSFLAQKGVGDRALVEAVNLLSQRQGEGGRREFVDYRTLGVRQLGSIYEGLLEYQPRYADRPMAAVRDGKGERWVAEAESVRPLGSPKTPRVSPKVIERREAGQVYLETDRGERKATGSYYTPQYIVEYIVDNTLGPLVEEARERVKARAKGARGKAARARAEQSFVEEILSLKALDPAMGSGHFLVEATEYLARALATDPYVETEAPAEEDLIHWKRRVVERCIYGVDRNPLAVELAKLSLWLATVAADRPLSFLDHHLQCGDSLVGAWAADLGWAPPVILSKKAQKQLEAQKAGQVNMFEYLLSQQLPVMLGKVLEITEVESDSYETVQAKEAADQAVRELKAPFQAVADLWVSAYFVPEGGSGHEFTPGEYEEALGLIGKPGELLALPAVQQAREMGDERRFFHWELAFPEVFYDQNGQPLHDKAGFDAVVGNPPYLTTGTLRSVDMSVWQYYKTHYVSASSGKFDIYLPFLERAWNLIGKSGRVGYILPNKWLKSDAGTPLRKLLVEERAIESVTDFSARQVFEGITTYTCICILSGQEKASLRYTEADLPLSPHKLSWFDVSYQRIGAEPWSPGSFLWTRFDNKQFLTLEQIATVFVGTSTNADDVFILERAQIEGKILRSYSSEEGHFVELEPEICVPFLRGKDISRYDIANASVVVLFPYNRGTPGAELIAAEVLSSRYPMAWNYLNRHRSKLEARENGRWKGADDWYCHAYPRNHGQIQLPKLLTPDICNYGQWVLDPEGKYHCLNTVYGVSELRFGYGLSFLLAALNSKPFEHFMRLHSVDLRGGYYRVTKNFMSAFPIPRIAFTAPADVRARLAEEGRRLYQSRLPAVGRGLKGFERVLGFVEQQLSQEPERADVIHDLLAYLAEQMMEMNKRKQAAVEAFWLDLEGVTEPATFETLRNKGKQEATLWKRSEACRPFVNPESHATRSLEESLAWDEEAFKAFVKALARNVEGLSRLVRVYQAHSPAYQELISRLEATDRLIDQIVYRLYGLTQEEIMVVEGRQPEGN
jgi:type I restriction-modification system DNA methylase subunit